MKLVAVTETILTAAGLMRPGIPYALDEKIPAHRAALESLMREGSVGYSPNEKEAQALLGEGLAHYSDDTPAPVFEGKKAKARADADAKAQADADAKAQADADAKAQADADAKAQADAGAKAQADAGANGK